MFCLVLLQCMLVYPSLRLVQNLNISDVGRSLCFQGPCRLRLHLWSHLHDFSFGFRLI